MLCREDIIYKDIHHDIMFVVAGLVGVDVLPTGKILL